jgi:hypothetical protein
MKKFLLLFILIYCEKVSSQNWIWAKSGYGQYGSDEGYGVATDALGNVYTTGAFQSSPLVLGTYSLTNSGSFDIFIAKYGPTGNVLWAKGVTGTSDDYGNSITSDASGNVYITGLFHSPTMTFGTYTVTNAGNYDIFIAKYNSSGTVLWAKSIGGNNRDEGTSVTTDFSGNVYITGGLCSSPVTIGAELPPFYLIQSCKV